MYKSELQTLTERVRNLQRYGFSTAQIAKIAGCDEELAKSLKVKRSDVERYDVKLLTGGQRSYYKKCKNILKGEARSFICNYKELRNSRAADKKVVINDYVKPNLKPVTHKIKNITTDKPVSLVVGPEDKALLIDIEMLSNGIKITW